MIEKSAAEDEISPGVYPEQGRGRRNDNKDCHFERNEMKREICLSMMRFLLAVEMTIRTVISNAMK